MTDEFRPRYPGYDVLERWNSVDWDDATRRVVRRRLEPPPTPRFFTGAEIRTLEALAERILPQPDRNAAERVLIVPWIDAKLAEDQRDGWRLEGLPPQRELWRAALVGVDETAQALYGAAFADLDLTAQDEVLRRIARGDPPGSTWVAIPAKRFFSSILCATVVTIYYAHPTAWSETGYNGPSSPRGHVRKWIGGVDPWEAHERQTRWGTK